MRLEIVPFENNMLPAAAHLLAQRHRRDRTAMPLLPARFEDPTVAERAVRAVLERPMAQGFAAVRGVKTRRPVAASRASAVSVAQRWSRPIWIGGLCQGL